MSYQGPNLKLVKAEVNRLIIKEREILGTDVQTALGAISVETPCTLLDTGTSVAVQLANGYEGQVKKIIMIDDDGDVTLTPANFANGSTITFDTLYEVWEGIFHAGSWYTIGTPTTS